MAERSKAPDSRFHSFLRKRDFWSPNGGVHGSPEASHKSTFCDSDKDFRVVSVREGDRVTKGRAFIASKNKRQTWENYLLAGQSHTFLGLNASDGGRRNLSWTAEQQLDSSTAEQPPIMHDWVRTICFHSSRAVPLATSRGIVVLFMQLGTGSLRGSRTSHGRLGEKRVMLPEIWVEKNKKRGMNEGRGRTAKNSVYGEYYKIAKHDVEEWYLAKGEIAA
ncbi:hypothetical protein PAMP_015028 [Pampus punctatissimus]